MAQKKTLDLTRVIAPLDFLKCKQCLSRMNHGDQLDVILSDALQARTLVTIIQRSRDKVMRTKENEKGLRMIRILKGPAPLTRKSKKE